MIRTIILCCALVVACCAADGFAQDGMDRASKKQFNTLDLGLTGSVTPASIPSGGSATYSFTVTNHGGSVAPNVVLVQDLPSSTELVSAVPSSGFCHTGDGHPISAPVHETTVSNTIYCKVGDLQPSAAEYVTIIVRTAVFGDGIYTTPIPITSDAHTSAEETDPNLDNNQITLTFNSIPSTNRPPAVRITNPAEGAVFATSIEGSVSIPLKITAADADGTVSEVKVFDSGIFAGNAVSAGNGNYTYNLPTTVTNYHSLSASAKDNGERVTISSQVQILVNSPHTIVITRPTQQLVDPGSTIEIETRSSVVGNRLQKIEIYDQGILLERMRSLSNAGSVFTHRLVVPNIARGRHSLTAILTDLTGATTISQPFSFKATLLPTVSITAPANSSSFPSGASIDITVQTADGDGYVRELNFYANGKTIGTKSQSIVNGSSTFRWIGPAAGVYSIIVKATDDNDETVSSNPVSITVNRRSP